MVKATMVKKSVAPKKSVGIVKVKKQTVMTQKGKSSKTC